jgi:hypothetical protein
MQIINEGEMSERRLHQMFSAAGVSAGLEENRGWGETVRVQYEDAQVIVWVQQAQRESCQLRFRSIVIPKKELGPLDTEALEDVWDFNQQLEAYGAVSTTSALGITIEYRLPFKNGVLDETVLAVARGIADAAPWVKECFRRVLERRAG